MFITYATNVDYLLPDIRLRIGDLEGKRYSDSIIRTALLAGVKNLQRRWQNRYLVFTDLMLADPGTLTVPSGYVYAKVPQGYGFIPTGLKNNDVFRNPFHVFADPGSQVFSQEDETPIIISSSLVLRLSQLSSSAESFQRWSDGDYDFSNIESSKTMNNIYEAELRALEEFFKSRLASPLRDSFSFIHVVG